MVIKIREEIRQFQHEYRVVPFWLVCYAWASENLTWKPLSQVFLGKEDGVYNSYCHFCTEYDFKNVPKNVFSAVFDEVIANGRLPEQYPNILRPVNKTDKTTRSVFYQNVLLTKEIPSDRRQKGHPEVFIHFLNRTYPFLNPTGD